jgi:hypothetical protein
MGRLHRGTYYSAHLAGTVAPRRGGETVGGGRGVVPSCSKLLPSLLFCLQATDVADNDFTTIITRVMMSMMVP